MELVQAVAVAKYTAAVIVGDEQQHPVDALYAFEEILDEPFQRQEVEQIDPQDQQLRIALGVA